MSSCRSRALLLPAALALVACSAPWPEEEATRDAGPAATIFRWEEDPRLYFPAFDPPLAAGAVMHVGLSGGACVESLVQPVASSDCGEIVGLRPGWTQLLARTSAGRLLGSEALQVAEPSDLDLLVYLRDDVAGRAGDWPAATNPEEPIAVPFAGDVQVLAVPRNADGPLAGIATLALDVWPPGALAVAGYGRYFRLVCSLTGPAEASFTLERAGATARLAVECLEPADGGGGP